MLVGTISALGLGVVLKCIGGGVEPPSKLINSHSHKVPIVQFGYNTT